MLYNRAAFMRRIDSLVHHMTKAHNHKMVSLIVQSCLDNLSTFLLPVEHNIDNYDKRCGDDDGRINRC